MAKDVNTYAWILLLQLNFEKNINFHVWHNNRRL